MDNRCPCGAFGRLRGRLDIDDDALPHAELVLGAQDHTSITREDAARHGCSFARMPWLLARHFTSRAVNRARNLASIARKGSSQLALQLVHDLLLDIQHCFQAESFIKGARVLAGCRLLHGASGDFYSVQKPVIFEALLDEEADGSHWRRRQSQQENAPALQGDLTLVDLVDLDPGIC